jgi:putative Mn2+ efflux pump MntP
MDFLSVFALAVGLAMDATAVSAARGLAAPSLRPRHYALVAVYFGGFQAAMPLAGWALGSWVGPFVAAFSPWIAFVLLGAIGGKMIYESRAAQAEDKPSGDLFGMKVMLVLAVATSIDAFAVGITLPMLKAPMALSLTTIGVTTAVLSAAGLALGRRFGNRLGRKLDAFGGGVLVLLGGKILAQALLSA